MLLKLVRWQHLAVGYRARFAVTVSTCFVSENELMQVAFFVRLKCFVS